MNELIITCDKHRARAKQSQHINVRAVVAQVAQNVSCDTQHNYLLLAAHENISADVVITEQYNVMVNSEELIGTTECLTL